MRWALLLLVACAHAAPAIPHHVSGTGPSCIVIPGGPGLGWKYARMPELEKRLQLVYIEPIGTGSAARLPAGQKYTLDRYAEQIEALRVELGAPSVCLIGHSHGGEIAVRYASQHPDRVSALVLVSSPSRADQEFGEAMVATIENWKDRPWFAVAKRQMLADDAKSDADAHAQWLDAVPLLFADWDAHAAEYRAAVDVPAYAIAAGPGEDLRPELSKITARTLVIVGAHDFCCGEKWGKELAGGIRGARLEKFEQSGHMPYLEEAGHFADVVAAFVSS
jgi:proline iminopeptidase